MASLQASFTALSSAHLLRESAAVSRRDVASRRTSLFFGRELVSSLKSPKYRGRRKGGFVRASSKPGNVGDKVEPAEGVTLQESVQAQPRQDKEAPLSLADINPYGLGRRSRELFDDIWQRLTELSQLGRSRPSTYEEDALAQGPTCEFTIPDAAFTTVLVAGATGRVGRIVVRKLLLRGYTVKALVRKADEATREKIPQSVELVEADIGDLPALTRAMEGVNKVICCVAARTTLIGDVTRVEADGVRLLAESFQDFHHQQAQNRAGRSPKSKLFIANFKRPGDRLSQWELREGVIDDDPVPMPFDGGMDANLERDESNMGSFSGYVYTRGGFVEMTTPIQLPDGFSLARCDALVVRMCGDGKPYSLVLETDPAEGGGEPLEYSARFIARDGFSRVRIPFSDFRPLNFDDPPLDPALARRLSIRFEPRRQRSRQAQGSALGAAPNGASDAANHSFKLDVHFIKALPALEEPDFILVSCTGAGVPPELRDKILKAKSVGENALRMSGLGYTIVRPGPLIEEPGGQRALVFDQGNRITQKISCADVADVCVKALHEPTARTKSFEVCYEYTSEEGQGLYELVAHLPDKSNNYLTPALALLEANT